MLLADTNSNLSFILSWRRRRDTGDEGKFRPIVLTAVRVALVVGVLRLADTTILDTRQDVVTFGPEHQQHTSVVQWSSK